MEGMGGEGKADGKMNRKRDGKVGGEGGVKGNERRSQGEPRGAGDQSIQNKRQLNLHGSLCRSCILDQQSPEHLSLMKVLSGIGAEAWGLVHVVLGDRFVAPCVVGVWYER